MRSQLCCPTLTVECKLGKLGTLLIESSAQARQVSGRSLVGVPGSIALPLRLLITSWAVELNAGKG